MRKMEFLPKGGLKKFPLPESQRLVVGLVVVVVGQDGGQESRSGSGTARALRLG